jgi:hypothetical protein
MWGGSRDISDVEALAVIIGFETPAEALALVEAFYPSSRIPPKVRFGVEEITGRLLPPSPTADDKTE